MKLNKKDQLRFANLLRAAADEVERGEITHFLFCYENNRGECYESLYRGQAAALGMMEMAKNDLLNTRHDEKQLEFLRGLAEFDD